MQIEPAFDDEVSAFQHVVERADVRMIQLRNGLGFSLEPLAELRVAGDVRGQDFDRDGAIEAGIAGAVDLSMPPAPSAPVIS